MGEMADYYAENEFRDDLDYADQSNVIIKQDPRLRYPYGIDGIDFILPRTKKMNNNNNKKITHKFYVGSPHLIDHSPYTKKTLAEAIIAASEKAQETEQDQIVVQIVRVIRVKKCPIVVEKV